MSLPNIKESIAIVEKSSTWKAHCEKNEGYELAHAYGMLGPQFEVQEFHIGYRRTVDNNTVVATVEPDPVQIQEESAPLGGGEIDPLDIEIVNIEFEDMKEIVLKQMEQEHGVEDPNRFIVILQTIEGKPMYNVTVITKQFNFINMRIDAVSGDVTGSKKDSVFALQAKDGTAPDGDYDVEE